MPELVTYLGRPVKRRERQKGQLKLTLVNPTPGAPGDVLTVTQDEWARNGKTEFYADRSQMPDVRELARSSA